MLRAIRRIVNQHKAESMMVTPDIAWKADCRHVLRLIALIAVMALSGCGGGGNDCGSYLNCPVAITITPSDPTLTTGMTQAFTATATYQDGSKGDVTTLPTVTWTSTNMSVATVNAGGLAATVGTGTTTITATWSYFSLSGSTVLTVAAPLTSPAAATASPALELGAISPDGRHFYHALSTNQVAMLSANSTTDSLGALATDEALTKTFPRAIAIDPAGRFLYVADSDAGSGISTIIDGFMIDSRTGALTKLASSPFQVAGATASMTVDPSGRFLYVGSFNSPAIDAFTIEPDTGTLSAVPGSPFAAAGVPLSVLVDPSGQFLYVGTNSATAKVLWYTIDQSTGALTPNASGQ
jgi:6-phosphogluconolactonase